MVHQDVLMFGIYKAPIDIPQKLEESKLEEHNPLPTSQKEEKVFFILVPIHLKMSIIDKLTTSDLESRVYYIISYQC